MTAPTDPSTLRKVRAIATGLVLLAAATVWLLVAVHGVQLDNPAGMLLALVLYAVLERLPMQIPVRDQSIATTASEFVTVPGLFLLSPVELVVARSLARLTSRYRGEPVKNIINSALVTQGQALTVLVAYALAAPLDVTAPVAWAGVVTALVITSVLDMTVLSWVIRVATRQQGRLGPAMVGTIVATSIATASVALATLVLGTVHPAGALLAAVPALVMVLGLRAYLRHRTEASRLRTLYDVSLGLSRAPELEVALSQAVVEARAQLRCHRVDLELRAAGPGGLEVTLGVDREDVLRPVSAAPRIQGRDADELLEGWLQSGTPDAVVDHDHVAVPVRAGTSVLGLLVAHGRPQSRPPFGDADVVALQALADHIGTTVERGQMTARLRTATEARDYLASHDPLTGLGNRRWFVAELEQLVAVERASVTVALVNVRGFRRLNERVGQVVGDAALVTVADHLRRALPSTATLARLAGDEFAIALPVGDPVALATVLGVPAAVEIEGATIELPMAAGIARWPGEVLQPSGLLRAADLALAEARRDRRRPVVHYDAALALAASRRSRLAGDLRRALTRGELTLHYQPLVDLQTQTVVAAEALARWEHPDFGRVPPDEFVAIAEETGDIGHLTHWVLHEAARQAAAWVAAGHRIEVGINISAIDLESSELVHDVRTAIEDSGVEPGLLVLEITETAAMEDRSVVDRTLAELADLGVQLAIDDFGTGHSSLAYLHTLPVGEVKVDRAFVDDVTRNEVSESVVRAVTDLAATRALVVVAEGVEDEATRARLLELGVARGQGWHFGRPGPAGEFPLPLRAAE